MLNSNYTHLAPTIPWGYENALFKLNYHRKETKQYYKRVPLAYVQESPAFTPRHLHAVGGYNIATSNKHGPRQMCLLQLVQAVGK